MQGSPYYPQVTPERPPRSYIPRVVGIIALVFAVIGLGGSLLFTFGPLGDLDRRHEALGFVISWLWLWLGISSLLFLVHLIGGILVVTYRSLGLRLLTGYAIGALLLIVIDLVLLWGYAPHVSRVKSSLVEPRTIFDLLALPWPVIVLALVNTRRAREACR